MANIDMDRLSIEDRLKRLENSIDERLIKHTSEAMNASVTLCKASEDRTLQKIEALRREFQLQGGNTPNGGSSLDLEALRASLMSELQQTVGQEFGNLRLELAARGVPVMAGLPAGAAELVGEANASPGQSRKTGMAGLVDVITDCVVEKVKEDQCIRNVSEQHEQLKEAIKDVKAMAATSNSNTPGQAPGDVRSPDFDSLHSMMKEMMKISYSLAKELGTEKEQRSRDFMDAAKRLEVMEHAITSGETPNISQANSRTSSVSGRIVPVVNLSQRSLSQGMRPLPKKSGSTSQAGQGGAENPFTLERVMGGLQKLVLQQDSKPTMPPSPNAASVRPTVPSGVVSPRTGQTQPLRSASASATTASPQLTFRSQGQRDSSVTSQGSNDDGQDWSTEVRALRSRLENIFQLGNNGVQDALGSSLGAGSTVGSLPTVQETTPA
jgi:hypothetical protein